ISKTISFSGNTGELSFTSRTSTSPRISCNGFSKNILKKRVQVSLCGQSSSRSSDSFTVRTPVFRLRRKSCSFPSDTTRALRAASWLGATPRSFAILATKDSVSISSARE
ncbi:hypothetical protein N337_07805, partial [Phoenicopterus ruber ruber]